MAEIPFALGPRIGRGGQADVFAATEPLTGAPLAVKVQHLSGSKRASGSIEHEYQLLHELEHPAFATAHACGRLGDGRRWLAMSFLEGVELGDWARALGPVGTRHRTERVLGKMAEVAEAVAYLHGLGVVHGDLKPGNVRVAPDGTPRILDLGGAFIATGQPGRGFFVTVAYAAPEQLDRASVAPATDVFALAATTVRLLTDQHPFGTGSREAVRDRHGAFDEGLLERAGALPAGVRTALVQALSVAPERRFADAAAWRETLLAAMPPPPAWPAVGPVAALQRDALGGLRQQLVDAPGRASLVVVGPHGSGKAALLAQLATDAAALGALVVSARGDAPDALAEAVERALSEDRRQVVIAIDAADRLPSSDARRLDERAGILVERGARVMIAAATHEAGLTRVTRWLHKPTRIAMGAVGRGELRAAFPELGARAVDHAVRAADGRARFACELARGAPATLRALPHEPLVAAILEATAIATATPDARVELATLATALDMPAATVRLGLDRLERHDWARSHGHGGWGLAMPELARALAHPSGQRVTLAARLADEWEGDTLSPGRAHCLLVAERHAAAADAASRWAQRALRAGKLALVARALESLAALDTALPAGPARSSWLLLRARAAALSDPSDARVDAWLGTIRERAQGTRDATRADDLAVQIGTWRGGAPLTSRPLVLARRELDADRYDSALALARGEVESAEESGAHAAAAHGALVCGEALAALGRLDEAARALADAAAWWPDAHGAGVVAAERAEVLAALGRWGDAQDVLARAQAEVVTPWDRAAVLIGAAARASDRGHARQALALLEPLASEPCVMDHARLAVSWTLEHLRALALEGRGEALEAARRADPLVAALIASGRRGPAARIGAWQAAAAWIADHTEDAIALADEAVTLLDRVGHRLWWSEAATTAVWIRRGAGAGAALPATLHTFFSAAEAWPLAMRAALAEGDIGRAWDMARRFMAYLDEASLAALELAPWAVRARLTRASDVEGGAES